MIFDVMSKIEAIEFSKVEDILPCIIISITNPGDEDIKFYPNSQIKDILSIKFFDSIDDLPDAMREEDALKIKNFIDKWKNKIQHIVIHCEEGISRSAGVAKALMLYLNNNNQEILNNKRYYPNERCFRLVKKIINDD